MGHSLFYVHDLLQLGQLLHHHYARVGPLVRLSNQVCQCFIDEATSTIYMPDPATEEEW